MVALDATYEIWNLSGKSRQVAAKDFQLGSRITILQPGEVLRRILIPLANLKYKINYQRFGIAASDPALAIVVGVWDSVSARVRLVINASVAAPRLWEFDTIETIIPSLENVDFIEDARASVAYRQEITAVLIKRCLSALLC
jgi:CO/xanthine dehydrogenase FAD-binding subunit